MAEDKLLPVAGKEGAQGDLVSHPLARVLQVVPEVLFCLNAW